MPVKKAAFKAIRQDKKRAAKNNQFKSSIAYLKRKLGKALEGKDKKTAQELYAKLNKTLDKAVQKNITKKNTANRAKSRLAKKVNALK